MGEAFSMLANILEARGELDEALRIRRDEVLPVFEQIGDVSSCAGTLGQIANILHTKGEIDEALRIRKEEVLPVFEQLGDARSRASTLSQIADILQARGEIDEALRIRKDRELPVYQKLGDVRAGAVTLGKIATRERQAQRSDSWTAGCLEAETPAASGRGLALQPATMRDSGKCWAPSHLGGGRPSPPRRRAR